MAVLGIDTSNYRTSLCVIDQNYRVLAEANPLLPVPEGSLGLQQSQAVFAHLKQWSRLLTELDLADIHKKQIEAVGVSTAPRPVDGSYMPVFKVGEVLAETIAAFLSVPLFRTSHQEGHIAAGEHTLNVQLPSPFIAVHLSGGTSEILLCKRTESGYSISRLGGTLDLHAGQLIDRVGVKLGFPFPSGPHLEKAASQWEEDSTADFPVVPSFVKEGDFSFSGPATHLLRLIDQGGYSPGQIARAAEHLLVKTLEKALRFSVKKTNCPHIMLVGGVTANRYLRRKLREKLERKGIRLYFADVAYATDNAFGVACLALRRLQTEGEVGERCGKTKA